MEMPFGKYAGHELPVIPTEYFIWLLANIPLREPLATAVAEEFARRKGYSNRKKAPEEPRPVTPEVEALRIEISVPYVDLFYELVEAGYRATAMKAHPDVSGGNGEKMRDLNVLMASIRNLRRSK